MTANPHAPPELGVAGEDRRLPAGAFATQHLAQLLVQVDQTGRLAQALAIGRIADNQPGLAAIRVRREGRQLALIHLHPFRQPCPLDIVAQRLQQPWVRLVTANPQRRTRQSGRCPLLRFVQQPLPHRRYMLQPAAEAPVLAVQVGRHVGGHQARLHQKGTRAAHRVGQRRTLRRQRRPVRADQYRRRQVLLQRRGALLQPVAALVQAVAGQVQRQLHFAMTAMHIHPQVRTVLVHRRPYPRRGAQPVHNRILDPQRTEVGVVHARKLAGEIHRQGAIAGQMVRPVDLRHAVIQTLCIAGREAMQNQQNPVGQARPQAQTITQLDRSACIDAGQGFLGRLGTQRAHLIEQQPLDSLRTGDKKFKGVAHLIDFRRYVTFWLQPTGLRVPFICQFGLCEPVAIGYNSPRWLHQTRGGAHCAHPGRRSNSGVGAGLCLHP